MPDNRSPLSWPWLVMWWWAGWGASHVVALAGHGVVRPQARSGEVEAAVGADLVAGGADAGEDLARNRRPTPRPIGRRLDAQASATAESAKRVTAMWPVVVLLH